ncbi:DUF3892 domain-containing protein [Geomicrobium sp. JSM 1781026]|uniref:DUF3892 domain-containing protein n=1 Tax=Geomicrobium sp. JSM 1781026 TaxID=3344580 RepID=UPI0035C15BD8
MTDFEDAYERYKNEARTTEPDIGSDHEQIVAVRKNEDGNLIAFKTNRGRELDYPSALQEAKAGTLAHVDVFQRYGRDILRSEPDGDKSNNFDSLDTF